MQDTVQYEEKEGVAYITLDRTSSLNSYNLPMSKELLAISERIREHKNVKAVLLQGAGKAFMAGGDLSFFKENIDTLPQGVRDIIRTLAATIMNFRQSNVPIVAAVHGAVAGAGMSIMLACDLVLAHEDTTFTTAYAAIGTSPDGGLSYFLPQLVGPKIAMELLLLPARFDVKKAERIGLVNQVLKEEVFKDTVDSYLKQLTKGPGLAYASIKSLVYTTCSLETQLELEAEHFVHKTTTEDFKEGVSAFMEKRQAKFQGK